MAPTNLEPLLLVPIRILFSQPRWELGEGELGYRDRGEYTHPPGHNEKLSRELKNATLEDSGIGV